MNSHWIIYNPVTNYFYVADPGGSHIFVLDATKQTKLTVINIPGAYSLDDIPDHRTLYVGTVIGDLYTVDPVAMAVTNRYLGSQIGASGYSAGVALVMADGRLALLNGGISVDGAPNFVIWNPVDNSLSTGGCGALIGGIGTISRTPDRTKLVVGGSSGGQMCVMDEATGQSVTGVGTGFPAINFRITPDGKHIVIPTNTLTLPRISTRTFTTQRHST